MKIIIGIDSFKGSLTSREAGKAVQIAAERLGGIESVVLPIADGGEGTVDVLTEGLRGKKICLEVKGPLGEPVFAEYGIVESRNLAIIEMAKASGLPLVPKELRNPMNTTTYGVGELILDAIQRGCREFLIGIGGSATNDGGLGMLSALGAKFYDEKGELVDIFGRDMLRVRNGDVSGMQKELRSCTFHVACDVRNPLCGPNGASAVFGPQKGATPELVKKMDDGLRHFSAGREKYAEYQGAGAAGGLGFAFCAYLGAELKTGIDTVLEILHVKELIADADLVVTGEGRLDAQTSMGKAPSGLAKLAKEYQKPVIAFGGGITKGAKQCNKAGIDAMFCILQNPISLKEAMGHDIAFKNLTETAEQVLRLICCLAS